MRARRHLDPAMFSSVAGRRRLRRVGTALAGFVVGYLIAVFWLYPAPLFSSDHSVPLVIDRSATEARERLEKQGFRAKFIGDEPHPKAARGTVIWQDPPAGMVAPKGTTVQLTTSAGKAPVAVPDVAGLELALAQKVVVAAGLTVASVDSTPSSVVRGVVVATRPAAGIARDAGTGVYLVVSNGPAEISVPNVLGMTSQQARERMEQAALRIGAVTWRTVINKPAGVVIEQRPAPGTLSPRDGRVDIILSRKPTP